MRRLVVVSLLLAIQGLAAKQSIGQTYLNAVGNPSFGVNVPVPNGYINIANGNLHLEIPLATMKQRGNLSLDEKLVYDSRIWEIVQYTGSYWWPLNVPNSQAGWRFVKGNETGTIGSTIAAIQNSSCWNGTYNVPFTISTTYYNWTDPNGTVHPFSAYSTYYTYPNGCTGQTPGSYISVYGGWATDASGYYASLTANGCCSANISIKDKTGNQVYPQVIDRFGNYWSSDSNGNLIDDRGQTPVIVTQNGNITYYDVLSPNGPISNNGTRVRYTVTTEQLTPNTNFNQPPSGSVTEYQGNSGGNPPQVPAIQSIGLPDGSSYQFTYDSYAEIQTMTLPTGGVISYGFSNYLDSYNLVNRWLTSSTIDNYTTTYTPSVITSCQSTGVGCKESVNVHRPSSDETVYTLTLDNGAWDTNTTIYQGTASSNASVLQTVNQFDFSQPCTIPGCNGAQNVTKQFETDTLPAVSLSTQIQTSYSQPQTGQMTGWAQWDYYATATDSSGNPVKQTGTPTRSVNYVYTGFDVTSEIHQDAAGNPVAQANYSYSPSTSISSNVSVGHGAANSGGPYLVSITACTNASVTNCNTSSASSVTTSYTYDDAGTLRSSKDAKGNPSTTYGYDPTDTYLTEVDRPTTSTGGTYFSHVTKASYDPATGAIQSFDDENSMANGQIYSVTYLYEGIAGRLSQVTLPKANSTDSQGGTTKYSYPSANEIDVSVAQTASVNVTSSQIVDGYGRPSSNTVGSITTTQTYDINGRPFSVTNPKSGTSSTDGTTYTYYDTLDRVSSIQNADTSTKRVQITGNVAVATDELGNQSKQTFNAFGELTSVIEADPNSGALSLETDYIHDGQGNVTCIEQHGNVSGTGCSSAPSSDASSPWRVRRYYYNSLSQVLAASIPEHTYQPSYPAQQNCGLSSMWTDCYTYDPNGNLSGTVDNSGAARTYNYDQLDRLYLKTSPNGTQQHLLYDIGQNAVGHLGSQTNDSNATSVFAYDAIGRLVTESSCRPSNCSSPYQSVQATYDLAGNNTSIIYPDGRVVGSSFDSLNRLSAVTYQQWGSTLIGTTYWTAGSYAPPGLLQGASYGNGVQMQAQFNNRLSLTSLSYQTSGSSPQTYFNKSYAWDKNAMNLLSETNSVNSQLRQFGYDKLNRLISAVDTSTAATPGSAQITITGTDKNHLFCIQLPQGKGQRCSTVPNSGTYTITINGPSTFSASVQYSGESDAQLAQEFASALNVSNSPVTASTPQSSNVVTITSVAFGSNSNYPFSISGGTDYTVTDSSPTLTGGSNGPAISGGANQQYTLDAWGNLTSMGSSGFSNQTANGANQIVGYTYYPMGRLRSDGATTYTYDDDGMLVSSSDGTSILYDGVGQRAQVSNGGSTKEYYYFGGQLMATRDPSSGAWTDMVYAGGQKIAVVPGTQAGVPVYSLPDHIGSEVGSLDANGNLIGALDYTPFGQVLSGSASDPFIFTGLERDGNPAYGLDHAGFRQYSSTTGRWTTPDPFDGSYDSENPQTFNRYSYVLNAPLAYTDPSGLWPACGPRVANVAGTEDTFSFAGLFFCLGSAAANAGPAALGDVLGGISEVLSGHIPGLPQPGAPPRLRSKFVSELKGQRGVRGGNSNAPNNGRNCTASAPSGAGQSAARTGLAALLTAQFFTGTGPSTVNFGGGSFGSEGMASTDGVNTALNDYYMTGRTTGLYTFGPAEVIRTGLNSMGQFVGSFNWKITPAQGGISLQLTNYTSLWSLAYHVLPSHSRSSFGPLGTTKQTYTMFVPCS